MKKTLHKIIQGAVLIGASAGVFGTGAVAQEKPQPAQGTIVQAEEVEEKKTAPIADAQEKKAETVVVEPKKTEAPVEHVLTLSDISRAEKHQLMLELHHYNPVPLRAEAGSGSYHGTLHLLKGTLNGQNIDPAVPLVAVAPGDVIYGRITGTLRHKHGEAASFPVGYVAHWLPEGKQIAVPVYGAAMRHRLQDPSSDKGQRVAVVLSKKRNPLVAPKKEGVYHLSVVGAAVAGDDLDDSLQNMLSGTNWMQIEQPHWGNRFDVTHWGKEETLHATKYGTMFGLEEIAGGKANTAKYAATSIRVLVDPRVAHVK